MTNPLHLALSHAEHAQALSIRESVVPPLHRRATQRVREIVTWSTWWRVVDPLQTKLTGQQWSPL
ncbi:hypothetical protein LCGC14_0827930 [marine sediment metagenome]|uniref:Uncharacterized protein n=1 Tax=marine sediment metagenome TaxID=412755 RepID=A0A0F9SP81_9ZZZZ